MYRGLEKVPYPLGSEEWKSFINYAKAYYKEAIKLAIETFKESEVKIDVPSENAAMEMAARAFQTLLTSLMSPLAYLWEKWQLMTSEQRMPYATPEYKKVLEQRIEEVKKQMEKAEFGKVKS